MQINIDQLISLYAQCVQAAASDKEFELSEEEQKIAVAIGKLALNDALILLMQTEIDCIQAAKK